MNIKGIARIEAQYADGRVEVLLDNECNDICWPAFRRCFIYDYNMSIPYRRDAAAELVGGAGRWQLFYGAKDIKQSPLNAWYPADSVINAEVNYPVYTVGALPTDPDRMTIRTTIPAPVGGPRTIRVIGIDVQGNGFYPSMTELVGGRLTILRLSTPCTQLENVTLIITYELYFYPTVDPVDGRISAMAYPMIKSLFKNSCDTIGTYRNYTNIGNISFSPFELPALDSFGLSGVFTNTVNSANVELTSDGMYLPTPTCQYTANAATFNLSFAHVASQGTFIKYAYLIGSTYLHADNRYNVHSSWFQSARGTGDINPVQNVYGQRNTPPGPSQDGTANNTATMSGNLTFNVGSWTDPGLQRMVRVNIVNGGAVGVATYTLSVMDFIAGFAGNRWVPRTALLPQSLHPLGHFKPAANEAIYETLADAVNGGITYRHDGNRQVLAASCLRTQSGVSIYNTVTGQRTVFNTVNGLGVTAVSDGAVAGGYFWVSCANTGLWRISMDLTTVESITSPTGNNQAYQLCKKNDGNETLWVLFNGGLCKLTNPSDISNSLVWETHNPSTGSPTFTYTGITDNNWANVAAMVIDPDNSGVDQFLFVTGTLADNDVSSNLRRGYVWWDTATGTAFNPSTDGAYIDGTGLAEWNLTRLLQISDRIQCIGGRWLAPRAAPENAYDNSVFLFSYGSSNLMAITLAMRTAERFIPATIAGVYGGLTTTGGAIAARYPSMFIKAVTLQGIVANTSLNTGVAAVEFPLRMGANSFTTNMETTATEAGGLAAPLAYLPASNTLFTAELNPNCYGSTPFMIPPTHSKYAQYRDAFWRDYGWDGSDWVLGIPTARLTHGAVIAQSVVDDLAFGFTDGVSGTSFVAGEWLIFAVGAGIFKDNGVTYTSELSYSLDPTQVLAITGNVPQTPLGNLTDEPVTFSLLNASRSTTNANDEGVKTHCMQNRGTVFSRPLTNSPVDSKIIADQLIPASTEFDLRFKWTCIGATGAYATQTYGLATGTGTYTYGVHFRHDCTTGIVTVYNNDTLLATVTAPTIDGEFRIIRNISNQVVAYYDGVALHAPISTTSQFVILADAYNANTGQGWWDMRLTYTEARRVHRISAGPGLGCLHPKFSALTYSPTVGDVSVRVGSPTPLAMILDYTSAGVPLAGTGHVKVCPGAGWLVFHDSEPANVLSGSAVGHFILNNA